MGVAAGVDEPSHDLAAIADPAGEVSKAPGTLMVVKVKRSAKANLAPPESKPKISDPPTMHRFMF
jgi:hypothetical protein